MMANLKALREKYTGFQAGVFSFNAITWLIFWVSGIFGPLALARFTFACIILINVCCMWLIEKKPIICYSVSVAYYLLEGKNYAGYSVNRSAMGR
jgi:hypothetical protein